MRRQTTFLRCATAVAVGLLAVAGCSAGGSGSDAEAGSAARLPARLPPSKGKTFYVATNGSNSNPGTLTRPWRTIQTAASRLRPGQRAFVRAGTYRENVSITRRGTRRAPITIAAYPGEHPVIDSPSYPLEIEGAYWRIRGFVVQGARGTSSTNVYFESSAHHVELVGNEVRRSQDQGVYSEEETDHLFILANRIHDNGIDHRPGQHQSHGIYLQGTAHVVVNNAIWDHREGFGIQVYDQNAGSIIVHNTVVGSGHSGIVVGGSGGVSNITIRNNILAFNSNYGVQMDSDCPTGRVGIDTNVIYGNREGMIERGCSKVAIGRNLGGNPRFVSYARRNLALAAGSPAINRARAVSSPRTDIRGLRRPRGRGYDIGAYERAG